MTTTSPPAPVAQFQILARDPEAAAAFFASAFGWRVDAQNALGYRALKTGGAVDGGIWPAPPEGQPLVQLFVAVHDVTAAVARVAALGAKVIVPPQRLPDGDEMAIVLSPEGLPFGLMLQR